MSDNELQIERYRQSVEWLATRLARRWRQDRDDICHDLFVMLLTGMAGFDPDKGCIRTWLTWKWLNTQRRNRFQVTIPNDILEARVDKGCSPPTLAEKGEATELIHSALERLPIRERAILTHTFGIGGAVQLTSKELGTLCNCSTQWVSRLRNIGLERLRVGLAKSIKCLGQP